MKTALAITHVAFEDLGTLAQELQDAGYAIETIDACTADLASVDPCAHDLVVVLGGPIGVYEQDHYPFIKAELALLRQRLADERPTLGICLGAQLMAAALGARVYPGQNGKELGWGTLQPGRDAAALPALQHLLAPGLHVLHWHGDTFDLPPRALHLAASGAYANQAFAVGRHALGLQCHPEVLGASLERWYVGHACELAHARVDVPALRRDSAEHAPVLAAAARRFWRAWLAQLGTAGVSA